MDTKELEENIPAVHVAIYSVALSLDAFLLNGIPYGVFQEPIFPGFLEKVAGNLLRDLVSLEQQALDASQPKTRQVLAALRQKCQQLIDFVSGLRSFKTLSLQRVRAAATQIPLLRGDCVQLLEELEADFQTPKPFYTSRPGHSTALVNDFLANLGRLFEEEWTTSKSA